VDRCFDPTHALIESSMRPPIQPPTQPPSRSPSQIPAPAPISKTLTPGLLRFVQSEFRLDWLGIHGAAHWARVRYNGLALARQNGANPRIVELFAFLHDVRREHDGRDRHHGDRAAALAGELNGRHFALDRRELRLLEHACREHSDGHTQADITVQTCWDADRLDLGRVGIRPHPSRLCTDAAREKEMIAAAYARSVRRLR
jgi:uncharacterized protein